MSNTIVDKLYIHALCEPDEVAFRFLSDIDQTPSELTFRQLWQEAEAVSKFLKEVAEPGSCIMLFFPPGLAYISAFFGCLMAGMIAVPLYPPRKSSKTDRVVKVAQSCESEIALTTMSELTTVKDCWQRQNSLDLKLSFYTTDQINSEQRFTALRPKLDSNSPAFLQYTSGSTGSPKGVIITHANIISNVKHLSLTMSASKRDTFVNWAPLFHDMGLTMTILWPVYLGVSSTLMAPATFVRNPVVWLNAIAHYKGTICGAPNFAYDLCTNKIRENDLSGLDLSRWRVAFTGAEPVNASTLKKFSSRFSLCGFNSKSFYPCYGMAEATVFISGGKASEHPKVMCVDRISLAAHKFIKVDEENKSATNIVGCGVALSPHDLKIVDPKTKCELAEGDVGEIWFSGPSVSSGYWNLKTLSEEIFEQAIESNVENNHCYLRTGDLGVIWQNELYVTGRIKDLIILRGKNYYPQDIETSTVEAHEAVRAGYSAAFAQVEDDTEKLIVVTELNRHHFRNVNRDEVISAIRQRVMHDHQVNVDRVVLLRPYKIPIASSGKIQRSQTRHLLLEGELDIVSQSAEIFSKKIILPTTSNEQLIHGIWCRALKSNNVSVADNFFDVGGDSITAIEISAAISANFKSINVDVDQLLEKPTIKKMAEFIELQMLHLKSKQLQISSKRRVVRI